MLRVSESQLWLMLRCVLALLVSIHGWHRILDNGVVPFAHYMESRLPLGYYLVFVLQWMEIVGSLIFAAGFCVSALGIIFSIIYSCSIYFYHSQFGWFQSGGTENGAEYAFALVICFFACALASWPSSSSHPPRTWRECGRSIVGQASLNVCTYQLTWRCLGYLLSFLVMMHVAARMMAGSVQSMVALMPPIAPIPETLALLATSVQAGACLAILVNKRQVPALLSLAVLFMIAIIFHHLRFGWIVSGAEKDGAEYSFLLLVLALMLTAHQLLRQRVAIKST